MKRKTVSLCMIARDEEAFIGKAIKSALALVDEIVVVDTGSGDNTRIIAEGYGARVVDAAWQDDFAAARNVALASAACDWILVLDCDEQLQSIRPVDFQQLLTDPGIAGYRVRMVGENGGDHVDAFPPVRLFRSHPDIRYRYPIHEQVLPSLTVHADGKGLAVADSPLVIKHNAGGADQRSRKRDRNLRLLRKAVASYPEDAYFEYRLGSETLVQMDDEVLPVAGLHASIAHLESAWRKVRSLPPEMRPLVSFGAHLATDLAAALLSAGAAERAADIVLDARREWGDNPRLCLQAVRSGLARLVATPDATHRSTLNRVISRDLEHLESLPTSGVPRGERVVTVHAWRCRAELALADGRVTDAAEAFEQVLGRDQRCSAAWYGLAECARVAGDRKRALRLYLRAVTANEWNVHAWDRGCTLMEELGFHDNAQSWLLKLNEAFPERPSRESQVAELQPA